MSALSLNDTLGAVFAGVVASSILYGINVVQVYVYLKRSNRDGPFLRGLVVLLWSLDSLHLAFIVHGLYYYLIQNYGNYFSLFKPVWSFVGQILVSSLSDFIIRTWFCVRVWRLSGKSWYLTAALVPTSIVVLGGSLAFFAEVYRMDNFADINQFSWILYLGFSASVVADVILASALCRLLWKSRTGFRRTNSMLQSLITIAINNSVLTSLCALATLIAYGLRPNTFIYIGLYFILNKVFLNSLLATLNARADLRDKNNGLVLPMSRMNDVASPPPSGQSHYLTNLSNLSAPLSVTVGRETHRSKEESFDDKQSKQWSQLGLSSKADPIDSIEFAPRV